MTDRDPSTRPGRRRTGPLKRFFLRGLVLLLPTIITLWVLAKIVNFLQHNVIGHVARVVAWLLHMTAVFGPEAYRLTPAGPRVEPGLWYPSLGIAWLVCLGFVAFVGMVFGSFVGHRVWVAVENALMRLPAVRFVYPYVKQVTDFVFSERTIGFRQVVAVEYPRKGIYSLGFVTGRAFPALDRARGVECLSIFVPSSPTPMTGYVIFVPKDEVIYLPLTIDEALKMTVSGGVIKPGTSGD